MPVGIPRVFSNVPEPEDHNLNWKDIYERLYFKRIIFVSQDITNDIANIIAGMIVYLNVKDKDDDIHLFINSRGGDVNSGLVIVNSMDLVTADVNTTCIGTAASTASLILASGKTTKRLAFPHARVMMHEPFTSSYNGPTSQCILEANQVMKLRETVIKIYMEKTGKTFLHVNEGLNWKSFMSAKEAIGYGIIDGISTGIRVSP